MSDSTSILSLGNRRLLLLLLRRFATWDAADRHWLMRRLAADDQRLRQSA